MGLTVNEGESFDGLLNVRGQEEVEVNMISSGGMGRIMYQGTEAISLHEEAVRV